MSEFTALDRAMHKIKDVCKREFYDNVISELTTIQARSDMLPKVCGAMKGAMNYMYDPAMNLTKGIEYANILNQAYALLTDEEKKQ